jgi:hypothetical protein
MGNALRRVGTVAAAARPALPRARRGPAGHGHSAALPAFTLDGVAALTRRALGAAADGGRLVARGLIAMRWASRSPSA